MTSSLLLMLLTLFFSGMPIVFAIGFFSVLYAAFVAEVPLVIVPQQIMGSIDSFVLLAVPLFLLTGNIMTEAGITTRLLRFSESLVGWMRGGLAQVNVMTNVIMAGISGSGLADAAATGGALIPLMKEKGYGAAFSAALTSAASSIGPIIPPSIIMVVIGGLTSVSVGRMFLGGVVPGLMLGGSLALAVHIISRRRNYPKAGRLSLQNVWSSFVSALPALGLPLIIIAGIISGAVTPTESAAVAAVYSLILGVFYRQMSWKRFYAAVVEVGVTTGTILFIVGASGIFGWILISEQMGDAIAECMLSVTKDPTGMMFLVVLVLLVLGCFVDVMALLILTVPILMPLTTNLGIDPVHFGVVATIALTVGLVTPPFGLCMFLMCSMANISIEKYTQEVLPFLVCIAVCLILLVLFPQLVLYLPNLIMGDVK